MFAEYIKREGFSRKKGYYALTGLAENQINTVEHLLGADLGTSYRTFLREFGYLSLGGVEFCGVNPSNLEGTSFPSLVWFNQTQQSRYGLNPKYIVVADFNSDPIFAIDTSVEGEEKPIIRLHPRDYTKLEVAYDSFFDLFKEYIGRASKG